MDTCKTNGILYNESYSGNNADDVSKNVHVISNGSKLEDTEFKKL